MAEEKDYELDGLEDITLTSKQKEQHKFTTKLIKSLELAVVIGALSAPLAYGIYQLIPNSTIEYVGSKVQYLANYIISQDEPESNS